MKRVGGEGKRGTGNLPAKFQPLLLPFHSFCSCLMLRCNCSGSLRSPISTSSRSLIPPRYSSSVPPSRLLFTSTHSILRPKASTSQDRLLEQRRWISDEQHFRTRFGNLKVNLVSSPSLASSQVVCNFSL